MEFGSLRKVAATSAAEVCAKFEASKEAQALLAPGMNPAAFLAAIAEHGLWSDALRFLAFALPKREGVWWACLAARSSLPSDAPPGMAACIDAAEQWVFRPSDESRRATFPLAEAIGMDSPAAYAGLAAYWSGGSLAPVGMPEVPPNPALCPTAVAAAVLLSAVLREPHKAEGKYKALLASGVDIASGGNGSGRKSL